MDSYVYLIRNHDLYAIGSSRNIDNTRQKLKPGELIAYIKTKDSDLICKNLFSRYSQGRLPNSDYFRLTSLQVEDCKRVMKGKVGKNFFAPIFTGKVLFGTFLLSWLILSGIIIKFIVNPIFSRFI